MRWSRRTLIIILARRAWLVYAVRTLRRFNGQMKLGLTTLLATSIAISAAEAQTAGGHIIQMARDAGLAFDPAFAGDRVQMSASFLNARARTKAAVMELLNDPQSAQFRNVRMVELTPDTGVYCGEVNARNPFGAYAPFRRFYGILASVQIDGSDTFDRLYQQYCVGQPVVGVIPRF